MSLGFQHVSLSSEVMPMIRVVPRGFTACADAYLTPLIKTYVKVKITLALEPDLIGFKLKYSIISNLWSRYGKKITGDFENHFRKSKKNK